MACSCAKKKTRYEVVVKQGGRDRIVFTTSNAKLAETVKNRYREGKIRTIPPSQ